MTSVFNRIKLITRETISVKKEGHLLFIGIVSLSILYILQIISPLRLTPDNVIYLSMAESALKGQGFCYHGSSTRFPPGYPALIAILTYLGIDSSSVFIGLNLVFLTIGHAFAFYICIKVFHFDKNTSFIVILLLLLSFVFIFLVPFPLSDIVFYGVSMTALGCTINVGNEKYGWIFALLSILLVIAAIQIRTIGIALLLPTINKIGERIIRHNTFIAFKSAGAKAIIILLTTLISLIVLGLFVFKGSYTSEALFQIKQQGGGIIEGIGKIWKYRTEEVGELIINFPISRITNIFSPFIIFIGIIGIIITGYGIYLRRDKLSVVDYYFIVYVIILFFWPYQDFRFWLPIMPLLICYTIIALNLKSRPKVFIAAARIFITLIAFAPVHML